MDKIEYCLNCDLYQRPAIGEPGQCIYTGECVLTTPNTHDRNAALAALVEPLCEALESVITDMELEGHGKMEKSQRELLATARAAMEATCPVCRLELASHNETCPCCAGREATDENDCGS